MEEFFACAATALAAPIEGEPDYARDQSHNLPLLLTAFTSRRQLQRELGDSFLGTYSRDVGGQLMPVGKHSSAHQGGGLEVSGGSGGASLLKSDEEAPGSVAALEGEGSLSFDEYSALVRAAEPAGDHSRKSLRARFELLDADGNGYIDRREYVQAVLLERLWSLSTRVIDLFMQWDTDRSGDIDKLEFRRGIRALGVTSQEGFTDGDVDAVFDALDADGNHALDYRELATSLRLSKRKAIFLQRLHVKKERAVKVHAGLAHGSITGGSGRRGMGKRGSVFVPAGGVNAGGNAGGANGGERRMGAGEGGGAEAAGGPTVGRLQALSDEVQAIYSEYRELRTKLGPPTRKSLLPRALLSPRMLPTPHRAKPAPTP